MKTEPRKQEHNTEKNSECRSFFITKSNVF